VKLHGELELEREVPDSGCCNNGKRKGTVRVMFPRARGEQSPGLAAGFRSETGTQRGP
jgi:hypothetical protein